VTVLKSLALPILVQSITVTRTPPKTQHRKLKRWVTQTPPKTQHRKLKRWATRTTQITRVYPGVREGQPAHGSYRRHVMALI
jgi:hypothetical protein